ncbi:MAG TPA: hypothetical protein VGK14_12340 [Novimethylophilus sp.]|jgi:hypothetical protein|uniref:hypothetical protein n=1 Tax=Novimethylophilus sp. TaxID=2137426 RepID=UPI002F41DA8C
MMKSIFAMLCMMFALFAAPLVYAEEATDDSASSAQDEPLPPMIDPAVASDTSGQ